jgi:hypothetical protein
VFLASGCDTDGWKIPKEGNKGTKKQPRCWDSEEKGINGFEVVEEFADLMEDVMYWYEPKVMYKEIKEILKGY